MKKDIPFHKVENLAVAIVPPLVELEGEGLWDTYLINLKENPIANIIISSRGYGELKGEDRKTTVLRHFFEEIDGKSFVQIEPIHSDLFNLTNEYWVSFVQDDYMFEKKYIFVKGSIDSSNFTKIPFLDRQGVMII